MNEFYGAKIDAQQSINTLLSLPASGKEQDWEIELADMHRVDEMLQIFINRNLNHEERCALALLMIASMDEGYNEGQLGVTLVNEVRSALLKDGRVREAMAFYWIKHRRSPNLNLMEMILER